MDTYPLLAGHMSPVNHYRHMSQQRTSMRRPAPGKGVTLTAIPRIVSLSMASATAIGFFVVVGPAPSANATPCAAPEANVDPPAAPPAMPAPQPVVQPPTGRRPSQTNDRAPLPKLGPLISSLLKPGTGGQRYSAPIQPQAGVVPPPGPNPPAPGVPQMPP